jgi:hypothetical protein
MFYLCGIHSSNVGTDDPNVYRYLIQKSELTATAELVTKIPSKNLLSKKSDNTLRVPADNNTVGYSYKHKLQHHRQKQKPGDFCYACYDTNDSVEGISRKYFEILENL